MNKIVDLSIFKVYDELIEIYNGHYICAQVIHGDTLYELQLITNKDYEYSDLINDIWAYDYSQNKSSKRKIVYYLVGKKVNKKLDNRTIEDNDILYFTPFNRIDKVYLSYDEYFDKQLSDKIMFLSKNEIKSNILHKDKKSPILSIITTVFNNSKGLELAIQSVINQNNNEVEFIIKDGGSTDDINTIIEKYKQFIDVYISEKDRGLYYGMHQGFQMSKGKYLQILNSDDVFTSNSTFLYTRQMHISNYDYYAANILYHKNSKKIIKKPNHVLCHKIQTNHTTIAVKRSLYFTLGGFDFSYRSGADRHFLVKLLLRDSSSCIIDETIAHYRGDGFSGHRRFFIINELLRIQFLGYRYDIVGYIKLIKDYILVIIDRFKYIISRKIKRFIAL